MLPRTALPGRWVVAIPIEAHRWSEPSRFGFATVLRQPVDDGIGAFPVTGLSRFLPLVGVAGGSEVPARVYKHAQARIAVKAQRRLPAMGGCSLKVGMQPAFLHACA